MTAVSWSACRSHLDRFAVLVDTRVAWGEMDALGHVNNAVYFRYFETARIEYFERIGYWDHMHQHGDGPILAETRCRFKAPLKYPAQISIGARVGMTDTDRFMMEYAVADDQRVVAEGDALVVSYNYRRGLKTPLPGEILAGIKRLQQS